MRLLLIGSCTPFPRPRSELEAAVTRRFRERLHLAVVDVAAAVEDDPGDTFRLRTLRDQGSVSRFAAGFLSPFRAASSDEACAIVAPVASSITCA
jgi:hypothetical protein